MACWKIHHVVCWFSHSNFHYRWVSLISISIYLMIFPHIYIYMKIPRYLRYGDIVFQSWNIISNMFDSQISPLLLGDIRIPPPALKPPWDMARSSTSRHRRRVDRIRAAARCGGRRWPVPGGNQFGQWENPQFSCENIGKYRNIWEKDGKKQEHIETLLENMGTYIGKMLGFRLPKGVFL